MTSNLNNFVIVLLFGSLILLSFLLITNPLKVNIRGNRWFAASVFLWSTFWYDEIVRLVFQVSLPQPMLVLSSIQFLTPVVYYFSVFLFIRPDYRFRLRDMVYLALPAAYFTLLLTDNAGLLAVSQGLKLGLIMAHILFYGIFTTIRIRHYQKQIEHFASNTADISLKWLEYILYLILTLIIIVSIYNLVFRMQYTNLFFNSFMLVILFGIAYSALRQKELYPVSAQQREEIIGIETEIASDGLKRKLIPDSGLPAIKSRLDILMKEQQPYLDSELNLIRLSEMMQLTPHQLSYVINTGFNENFFNYINKFRVEHAKKLIVNETMNTYSILGIAFESGFNSKTAFNNTFKKITGLTPSEYKGRRS